MQSESGRDMGKTEGVSSGGLQTDVQVAAVEAKFGPNKYEEGGERLRKRREEQIALDKYNQLRLQLILDTVTLGLVGCFGIYASGSLRTSMSFGVGVVGSTAYVFLLSRSVDKLATAARQGQRSADILSGARLLLLGVCILFVVKNREYLDVLPALIGFFTYKLCTLLPVFFGEPGDARDIEDLLSSSSSSDSIE